MRSMASSTSAARSFQSLDIESLLKHNLAHTRLERIKRSQINMSAKQSRKIVLNADQLKDVDSAIGFDQDIDIAILSFLMAGERAKQRQLANAKLLKLLPMRL